MEEHCATKLLIIPGRMTPVLQSADLVWNKIVKADVKRQWYEWMSSQEE